MLYAYNTSSRFYMILYELLFGYNWSMQYLNIEHVLSTSDSIIDKEG